MRLKAEEIIKKNTNRVQVASFCIEGQEFSVFVKLPACI